VTPEYDVIIIGGGPSGSTCATLLAQRGRKVVIIEREKFPRFHIGESLTLFAPRAFRKLGVYEELAAANYVRKRGLEFILPDKSKKIYFAERWKHEPHLPTWTFQMARSKLDQILLRNAERHGAIVCEQHAVHEVLFDGDRAVGVTYRPLGEGPSVEPRSVYARWIIDCSGQSGVINRQLKNNCVNDLLLDDKISIFSHWTGDFDIVNSEDELNFKLCVHENRKDWFWWFPIDRNLVSMGVVIDRHSVKNREGDLEQLFFRYAADTPFIRDFVTKRNLIRTEKFRSVKDFSYRSKRYYGNGWVLTGDSAGFLDPIFSTGLQIAFNTAFRVVEILDKVLDSQVNASAEWAEYSATVDRLYRLNSTLVYRFYEAGIDFEKVGSAWYLLTRTKWATPAFLIRFLWHGAKVIMHPPSVIRSWARDVLFGNIQPGNRIADVFLVLAENYDALRQLRLADQKVREHFVELEV